MKTFFIVTNIDGEILSGAEEFATEQAAANWANENVEERCFIDKVVEVV